MRTEKSIKNIKYSLIGQISAIIISLMSRFFFLKILNSTYLGINGLFSNVLTMLSFIELGIGPALTFSLYEPLKNNDKEKTKTLLRIFKKSYIIIGSIIIIFGFLITPLLPKLVKDLNSIPRIYLIYWLFVINTGVSYFGSYKKTFLLSDQKGYITSKMHYILYFLMNLTQIALLYITHSFIIYLIIQIVFTIFENILVAIYISKKDEYGYLKETNVKSLDSKTKDSIKRNVKATVIHKFGSVVVTATDNLILSRYVGIVAVGLYSNYYLIINNIHKILKQTFNSTIASVGNLGAEGNKEKIFEIFKHVNFINYYLNSLCGILMLVLFQDFITLWLGKNYLFDFSIVVVLILCFYFTTARTSVLLFKEALGLYWQDRYKAFFEAIINLVVSIILAKKIGVIGVFIGTLISTLTTCFWIEPYVLFKDGLNKKSTWYFKDIFCKTLLTSIIAVICLFGCSFVKKVSLVGFVIKFIISFIIINLIYYVLYKNSPDYKYIESIIKNKLIKKGVKKMKVKDNASKMTKKLICHISPVLLSKILFSHKYKKKLDLDNPNLFNEKLMYLKIKNYDNNPNVWKCSDKYLVREYAKNHGVKEENLPNLIGTYTNANEINFNDLPDKFALKCTHGCGFNIICADKTKIDARNITKKLNKWLKTKFGYEGAETHYTHIKPIIICEEYLNFENELPNDYKVYCFNGVPKIVLVCSNRAKKLKLNFFDLKWNELMIGKSEYRNTKKIEKPLHLDEMIEISKKVSNDFPFVRVDFYEYGNKAIMGEMTFTPAACLANYYTEEGEKYLGSLLEINLEAKGKK